MSFVFSFSSLYLSNSVLNTLTRQIRRIVFICHRRRKAKFGVEGSVWFTKSGESSFRDEENVSPRRESMVDPFPNRFHSSAQDLAVMMEEDEPTRQVKPLKNEDEGNEEEELSTSGNEMC